MAVATGMVSKYFSRISVTLGEKRQLFFCRVLEQVAERDRFGVKADSPFLHPFPA